MDIFVRNARPGLCGKNGVRAVKLVAVDISKEIVLALVEK